MRQSGKNSADIRMVVDALDLCYTKSHVNTFVIVSGDSDFSPLVSKLRENAKYVIGVGVKQSTSDLLIANCDEFIFYDDLVRESQRKAARRDPKAAQPIPRRSPEEMEARRGEALELALETFEALLAERGDSGKIWASMLKEAIKRRKPDFNETYYGFRAFGNLLEEAQTRGLLELGRDEKSGAFVSRISQTGPVEMLTRAAPMVEHVAERASSQPEVVSDADAGASSKKRRNRNGNKRAKVIEENQVRSLAEPDHDENSDVLAPRAGAPVLRIEPVVVETPATLAEQVNPSSMTKRRGRGGSRRQAKDVEVAPAVPNAPVISLADPVVAAVQQEASATSEKKAISRNRRPRKPKMSSESA